MFNSRRYSGINRVNTHTLVLLSFGSTSYGTETGGATTKTKKNEELVGETFFPLYRNTRRTTRSGGGEVILLSFLAVAFYLFSLSRCC